MHKLIMGEGTYIHKNDNKSDNRKENLISIRGYRNNSRIYMNGYVAIYMPEHKKSFDNGCVYEHVLVAEKILERELKYKEVVHHKDKDRTNNNPDNLMVFQTDEDHIAFHGGAECVKDADNTYYCIKRFLTFTYFYRDRTRRDINNNVLDAGSIDVSVKGNEEYNNDNKKYKMKYKDNDGIKPKKRIYEKDICPICQVNLKLTTSKMCNECRKKEKAKNIPLKNELENLIYKLPFTQIGALYGVSDNAVRKWCQKYGLPYRRNDIKNSKLIKNKQDNNNCKNE